LPGDRRTEHELIDPELAHSRPRHDLLAARTRAGRLVVFGRESAMAWTSARSRLRAYVSHACSKRHAHRTLAQELATYATPADRDELPP
jgi:hypothetical protein